MLFALLGDRESAIQALAQRLKRGAFSELSNELFLFALRSDFRVQALLKDPANNAPLPVVNWGLERMLAELRAPDE